MKPKAIERHMTFGWSVVIGLVTLALPTLASADTRITGRIVYGNIYDDIGEDHPPDGDDDCVPTPDAPCGFLHSGDPIAHVWVQLNSSGGMEDHTITDANGRFSMVVTGTPNLTLVVKAKNDYVAVKTYNGPIGNFATDDVLEKHIDVAGLITYGPAEIVLPDLVGASDFTDWWPNNGANYLSRAFYITNVAHVSGTNVERLLETVIPGDRRVGVRMGIPGTAFFYTVSNTIFLENTDSSTFWHEYGHFLEKKLGGFDLIPAYTFEGQHQQCTQITGTTLQELCSLTPVPANVCALLPNDNSPSLEWAWIEGFATFIARLNSVDFYGSEAAADNALSGDHASENDACGVFTDGTDPRAVEGVVAQVLWDLVDDTPDESDHGRGVDEIALFEAAEVLDVFHQGVLGLEEFWQAFTGGSHDIQPHLFSAYASNGADLGSALDSAQPQAATVTTSHTLEWSNSPGVQLTITDGTDLEPNDHDDVSGSYKYFVVNDTWPQTWPNILEPETFKDAGTVKQYSVDLPDSVPPDLQQYIHVNSLDMKGHTSEDATHIGPFLIDTVDPFWIGFPEVIPYRGPDPTVTSSDKTLVLGYPALIKWSSGDALSGVAEVRVVFEDLLTGTTYDIVTTPDQTRNYSWFVEDVPVTQSARIVITVTDRAGNDIVHELPVKVVPHFEGPVISYPASDNGNCDDGKAISADLQRDGYDDVVLVCRINATGHLFVYGGTPNGLVLIQNFVWRAVDDLVAADLDRDGDLDVATVSMAIPAGGNTRLDILYNDGTGTLFDPAITRPLASLAQKTVRVLTPYDRKRPHIFVFGVLAAAGNTPDIKSYDVAAGYALAATPGLDPVDGDWEAGDLNRDGYQDLVALGVDGSGTAALSIFSGSAGGWSRLDAEVYGSATGPDVDLGDFDSDGKLDIFVMFEDAARVTKLLRALPGAVGAFSTFAEATDVAQQVAEGGGYVTDHANDGKSEVVAMGLDAAGNVGGWYLRNDTIVGMLTDDAVPSITPLDVSDTAWGDFDRDGDLDVFQLGHDINGLFIADYENLLGTYIDQNDAPRPPANLSAAYSGTGYVFSWTAPTSNADETPDTGLGYELRIGTTPTGGEILSWAHPAGASQQGSTLSRFVRMPQGNYYYDVRSVDSGWLRSAPAGVKITN